MSLTAICRGGGVIAIASDGTNLYIGLKGKVRQVVIATGVKTTLASVHPAEITAMASDGTTYLYVGDNRGQLNRVTISGGAVTLMEKNVGAAIVAIFLKTATLYMVLSNGRLASRSATP